MSRIELRNPQEYVLRLFQPLSFVGRPPVNTRSVEAFVDQRIACLEALAGVGRSMIHPSNSSAISSADAYSPCACDSSARRIEYVQESGGCVLTSIGIPDAFSTWMTLWHYISPIVKYLQCLSRISPANNTAGKPSTSGR